MTTNTINIFRHTSIKWACAIVVMLLSCSLTAATRRALVIGLGKQMDTRWGVIHGDRDVPYVTDMLQQAGYRDIRTLVNEQATKDAIVKAFKNLANNCRKGDIVYIHYSGHGQLMTDLDGDESLRWEGRHNKWDESWVPYDAFIEYGDNDHGEHHLSDDEVATLLSDIRDQIGDKGQLVVAIDACHSGDATCGDNDEYIRGIDIKFNIPRQPDQPLCQTPIEERWLTISACKPYQLCSEIKELKIGRLTHALHSMGDRIFTMDNQQMQDAINRYYAMRPSRMPQTAMVSGKK